MNTIILRARHLTKRYDSRTVVDDVSLNIASGSLIGLIGPNGAGKSTTISMIIGLVEPDSGSIEQYDIRQTHADAVDSQPETGTAAQINSQIRNDNRSGSHANTRTGNQSETRTDSHTDTSTGARPLRLGVVFQNSVLDGLLSARENLQTRARMVQGIPNGRVDEVLELVHARSFADQRYDSLSGGQRRSIDIARALLNNPDLLILDEPTTGLDIATRRSLWKLLNTLRLEHGLSILLTTHYLEEAEQAQQIYIIDHGSIKASGSARELIATYTQYALEISVANDLLNGGVDNGEQAENAEAKMFHAALQQAIDAYHAGGSLGDDGRLRLLLLDAQACIDVLSHIQPWITDFSCRQGSMNDVFLALTQHRNGTSGSATDSATGISIQGSPAHGDCNPPETANNTIPMHKEPSRS